MRWDSSATQVDAGSRVPLAGIAALVRERTEWLDRLDREDFVAVNLREATDPQTECVAANRTQVHQVLQEIAREIEGLAAGSAPPNDEPGVRVVNDWQVCCRSPPDSVHARSARNSAANSVWSGEAVQETGRLSVGSCTVSTQGPC